MTRLNIILKESVPLGSPLYYSLHYLDHTQAQVLSVLYAFAQTLEKIPYTCKEVSVAQAKFSWWHSEWQALMIGNPQHPLSQALQPIIETYGLHPQRFQNILNAYAQDLSEYPYKTEEKRWQFYRSSFGEVFILAAQILKITWHNEEEMLRDFGAALKWIEYTQIKKEQVDPDLARAAEKSLKKTNLFLDRENTIQSLHFRIRAAIAEAELTQMTRAFSPKKRAGLSPWRVWRIARSIYTS